MPKQPRRKDEYKRPDSSLTPGELAMLHRRIARSVKYGMSKTAAARHYRMDERKITAICAEFGVTLPTVGQRGVGAA